jgi:hypothetical protein
MYLSMGNIGATSQVGFLFMDFERPFRLRAQGAAEVSSAPDLLAHYKEAEQDVLREPERAQVARAGVIPVEDWIAKVQAGDEMV